jgi:hypothetical protein
MLLAKGLGKTKHEQPSQEACKHASYQKVSNHDSPLVAGEAEQVAAVMHELVHIHAFENRHGALFGTDKVDQYEHHQAAKNEPGQELFERNGGNYLTGRIKNGGCHGIS